MKEYPTHAQIAAEVNEFVSLCIDTKHFFYHNREGLDDLIADLMQYRKQIPTAEEYLNKNLL